MKYFLILIFSLFYSCNNTQPKLTPLTLVSTKDTVVIVDTIIVKDTIQIIRTKKELYCPINLANELEVSKAKVSKLEDSLYNLNVLQNTLLKYTPQHVQNAFKNK